MSYWAGYFSILVSSLGLAIGALVIIRRRGQSATAKKLIEGLLIAFLSLFLTFMAAEFYFKEFFAQTDNRNFTLASKNWFERYWVRNSYGFRDVEWSEEDLQTRRRILVMGDSFAAGQGIENVEDRFSNLLGQKLGNEYLVMNAAHPGFSTREQILGLTGFRYKPEILIFQYFLNDIRHAAERHHIFLSRSDNDPWPIFQPLVENSYAVNLLYWRGILLGPQEWQGDQMAWLKTVYHDPDVWWTHQQELLTIYEGARSEGVPMIVVVFPILTDVEGSRELSNQVVTWFRDRGVSVLDVAQMVDGVLAERLTVSNLDGHPSKWLHAQVADELYKMVQEIDKIPVDTSQLR